MEDNLTPFRMSNGMCNCMYNGILMVFKGVLRHTHGSRIHPHRGWMFKSVKYSDSAGFSRFKWTDLSHFYGIWAVLVNGRQMVAILAGGYIW